MWAEGAKPNVVPLFVQVERTIEYQPQFQWTPEEVAHQFEIADLSQALPASRFERGPVDALFDDDALEPGEVLTVVGEGLLQPGAGQRWCRKIVIAVAQLPLQQVETETPGHGLIPLAAYTVACGYGFAERQAEVVEVQLQVRRASRCG